MYLRAWTPSPADRRMPYRFFYVNPLVWGASDTFVHMEKTLKELSLKCLSNLPKLFDLNELLSSLKITTEQKKNMKCLFLIEGLTERQVRKKLSRSAIIKTNKFGVNHCLYYIFFKDAKGYSLCLFNGDKECFKAYSFSNQLLN